MCQVRECIVCHKFSFTRTKRKDFVCSDLCQKLLSMRKQRCHETLCWDCQNVTKCSWKDRIPVKGWKAEPHIVNDEEGIIRTYRVIKCPNFLEDEIRGVYI